MSKLLSLISEGFEDFLRVGDEFLELCRGEIGLQAFLGTKGEDALPLPLHTTDLPALSPSSSWASFLSRSDSNDSLYKILPEVDQIQEDITEIASSDDEDNIVVAPPKGCKFNFHKGYERYHPERYRCTGFEIKDYRWFDGSVEDEDQRFVIDLKEGSMDRLPDVRPFLYYIGYFAGDRSHLPRNPTRHLSPVIEDIFVTAGREYLLAEWQKGSGYFLMDRDWLDLNRWKFITIPYAACCKGVVEPLEGDIGFEREKVEMPKPRRFCDYSRDDYESVGDMMKTNIRVALPRKTVMKVAPGDDEWDSFIRHLYGAKHPVRSIMLQGYTVKSVKHEQVILDERYVTREATRVYPFDPECTAVFKSVSCPTQ